MAEEELLSNKGGTGALGKNGGWELSKMPGFLGAGFTGAWTIGTGIIGAGGGGIKNT